MGIDATGKWPGETTREWGRPIVMDEAVRKRVDALWSSSSLTGEPVSAHATPKASTVSSGAEVSGVRRYPRLRKLGKHQMAAALRGHAMRRRPMSSPRSADQRSDSVNVAPSHPK